MHVKEMLRGCLINILAAVTAVSPVGDEGPIVKEASPCNNDEVIYQRWNDG